MKPFTEKEATFQDVRPSNSPWGHPQQSDWLAPGIWNVQTASHGGIHVEPSVNLHIPEAFRYENGWYEEDCDYAIPYCFLKDHLKMHDPKFERTYGFAIQALLRWNPEAYERLTGKLIQRGESYVRDNQLFDIQHVSKLEVRSAILRPWTNMEPPLQPNMVLVTARTIGTPSGSYNYQDFFVPEADYDVRKQENGRTLMAWLPNAIPAISKAA